MYKKRNSYTLYSLHIIPFILVIILVGVGLWLVSAPDQNVHGVESLRSNIGTWEAGDVLIRQNKLPKRERVLVTTLDFDMNANLPLKISKTQIKNGRASKTVSTIETYQLELLSEQSTVLEKHSFIIPNKLIAESEVGDTVVPEEILMKKISFAESMIWHPAAKAVRIVDTNGNVVASQTLSNSQILENTPKFKTLKLSKSATNTKSTSMGNSATDEEVPTETVDVVFIGDDYNQEELATFHEVVNSYVSTLLTYEPINTRAHQFSFHVIDNLEDLGCTTTEPLYSYELWCNTEKIKEAVTNAGVEADKITVIYNGYMDPRSHVANAMVGSEGVLIDCCVRISGNAATPKIFVHEFGHLFGNLRDEYVYDIGEQELDNTLNPNCYKGNPAVVFPEAWVGIVGSQDYFSGCSAPNWYRSSITSIMDTMSHVSFNAWGQKQLNSNIDIFSGSFSDTVAPVGQLIGPENGSVVSYIMSFIYNVSDNNGVAYIQLWRDGVHVHTEYSGVKRGTFHWPLDEETNGTHIYQLKAFDTSGNVWESPPVSLVVDKVYETTKPTVSIVSPKRGASVTGLVNIQVDANDNSGHIKSVVFFGGGVELGADTTEPFNMLWDTSLAKIGTNKIVVSALDPSGNFRTVDRDVKVKSAPDTQPPVVLIEQPLNNTSVPTSGRVKIVSTTSDNVRVITIKIIVNGKILKKCDRSTQCAVSINVSQLVAGLNSIRIEASDIAKNIGTAEITINKN